MATANSKFRAFLELVRLPAVFTAPSDILLGLAIVASVSPEGIPWYMAVALLFSGACVYCAGMATNDLFDVSIDLEERPDRPIPSGRIRTSEGWTFAILMQVLALGVAGLVGVASLCAVALTIALTYLYNGLTKAHWSGPVFMGLCRYGNALIGVSVLGWREELIAYGLPIGVTVYVLGLTLCSRCEVEGADPGALKTGIVVLLFGSLTPLIWFGVGSTEEGYAGLLSFMLAGWLAVKAGPLTSGGSAGAVRGLVMRSIKGIACLNAILAAMVGGWMYALIAVCLLIPGHFFGRWFYST